MKVTVMLSSFCFVICTVLLQVEEIVHFSGKYFPCDLLHRVFNMILMVGLTSTYIFLWLRQYVFFRTSRFKHTNNIVVRVLSTLIIIFLFAHFFTFIVMSHVEPMATWTITHECHFLTLSEKLKLFFIFSSLLLLTITCTLFALFLYPLCTSQRSSTSSNDISGDEKLRSDIKRAIRISMYSTITCLLSDFFILFLKARGRAAAVSTYPINFFKNLSLLINTVTLIFTYENPGQILFGCCYRSGD